MEDDLNRCVDVDGGKPGPTPRSATELRFVRRTFAGEAFTAEPTVKAF